MAITNRNRLLEKYVQVVREDGLNTNKNVNIGIAGVTSTATLSVGTGGISTTGNINVAGSMNGNMPMTHSTVAANSTSTLTVAQIEVGYITSTSAAATTLTLPTGTALGAALGAVQGTIYEFYIDNTAGANTVTLAPGTNAILSAAAAAGAGANFGLFTVPSGATGVAQFTIMFSSSTAYVVTRTA